MQTDLLARTLSTNFISILNAIYQINANVEWQCKSGNEFEIFEVHFA